MSSTNRGTVREADDFYETPAWCTRAILPHLGPLAGKRILEPSAGRGAIVRELLRAGGTAVAAVERDADRMAALAKRELAAEQRDGVFSPIHGDFLLTDKGSFNGASDLIVMNPPFSAAQQHVEHAISLLAPGGICATLLRLAFCVSAKRAALRAAHPFDLYPLASRPSFTPDGKTDSADYAWFIFHGPPAPGAARGGGRLQVLEGKTS